MLRLFQKDEPPPPGPPVDLAAPKLDDELDLGGGARILCAACAHFITRVGTRTTVEGQHEHTRSNPGGFVHRFGCFRRAPGCVSRGVPSKQATWFADHFWWVQACGGCGEHLGWLFFHTSGETSFFGLIMEALREEEEAGGGSPPPA